MSPGHPSILLLRCKVPEPFDTTKAGFDAELLLAPHKDSVPPREDEELFTPVEASPLQLEKWPGPTDTGCSSLAAGCPPCPQGASCPTWMNEVVLSLSQPCLPLGSFLPFPAACGRSGGCSQSGRVRRQQAPSHAATLSVTPCSVPCPCHWHPVDTHPSPPGLHQATSPAPLPLQTCPCSSRPTTPGLPWVCREPCLPSLGAGDSAGGRSTPQVARG